VRSIRFVAPAAIGLLLLYVGLTSMAHDLQYYSETPIADVRGALLPIAIGVALLLAALALWRRSRAGYLLGLGSAGLLILAGLALVAIEIQYIAQGRSGSQYGWVFIVAAGIWIGLWALYARSLRRARASFEPSWKPGDRRFAIVLVALIVFSTAAHVGLGIAETEAAKGGVANHDRAEKLAQGTSLEVDANDVTVDGAGSTSANPAVQTMTLELSVHSLATYELAAVPTLCLTDLATALDPTYKPDTYCWGLAGRAITLDAGYPRLIVDDGTVTFRLDVSRGDSLCAFGSGMWNAELRVAPRVVKTDGSTPAIESFSVSRPFQVVANGQSLPGDPSGPTVDCIAGKGAPNPGS
jgi:hypothetical protein